MRFLSCVAPRGPRYLASVIMTKRALALALASTLLFACGGRSSGDAPSPSGSAKPAAKATGAPAAKQDASGPVTSGKIKTPKGATVPFTIALPAGLKNVSDRADGFAYAKSASDDKGPVVKLFVPTDPESLEVTLGKAAKEGFTVLRKEKLDGGGWIIACRFDKEKGIVVVADVVSGPTTLECRAFMKGPDVVAKPDDAIAILDRTCRSLTIGK